MCLWEDRLIEAIVSWEPWACGCLDGRRRVGAILVQQRCQGSAALEAARRHKRELVNGTQRGQAGSNRDGAQRRR